MGQGGATKLTKVQFYIFAMVNANTRFHSARDHHSRRSSFDGDAIFHFIKKQYHCAADLRQKAWEARYFGGLDLTAQWQHCQPASARSPAAWLMIARGTKVI